MLKTQDFAVLCLRHPLQGVSLAVDGEEWCCFAGCLTIDQGTGLLCHGVHDFWPCMQNDS